MKFEYNYTRNDLKKYLDNKNNNLILWVSGAYIFIIFIIILFSLKKMTLGDVVLIIFVGIAALFLLFAILVFILKLYNQLLIFIFEKTNPYLYGTYKYKIDKNKIVRTNNKYKVTFKKDDIKEIIVNNGIIEIYSKKDTSTMIIEKVIIGEELFEKVKEEVIKFK